MPVGAIVEFAGGYKQVSVLWVFGDALEAVDAGDVGVSPPLKGRAYGYEATAEDAFVELVCEGYTFGGSMVEDGGAVWDCLELGEAHWWAVVDAHYFTGASGSG